MTPINKLEVAAMIEPSEENQTEGETPLENIQDPSYSETPDQEQQDPSLESSKTPDQELQKLADEKSEKPLSSETPDQKLQELIDKMETALSQGGTPNFKLFWDLRKQSLELFKENISQLARTQFWARYRELSKEAKKLKDIFDEQSAFAVEQIEMAIKALENDIEEMPQHLEKALEVDFGIVPKSFEKNKAFYASLQKKLNLLNAHAGRVNQLRKELIKTEMRIKHKNNFFERLSKAGDRIFPERKEHIKEVSDRFEKDVLAFVDHYFGDRKEFVPTYALRDDIKHLQNIAKILTINSQAFSASRKALSESWDALKKMDKERKKEIQTKRDLSKKSMEEISAKIEGIQLTINENQITPAESLEMIEELYQSLRSSDLGRDEVNLIKEKLSFLKKTAQDKIKEKQEERDRTDREKRYKKQEAAAEFQRRVQEALQPSKFTLDELKDFNQKIREEAQEFSSPELGKKLKALSDLIVEKEEEAMILNASSSAVDGLKALREILQHKKKRRTEIKEGVEKLRRAEGNSGLDIEKALRQNEQLTLEKERLEKADNAIAEIEEKIVEAKEKLRASA